MSDPLNVVSGLELLALTNYGRFLRVLRRGSGRAEEIREILNNYLPGVSCRVCNEQAWFVYFDISGPKYHCGIEQCEDEICSRSCRSFPIRYDTIADPYFRDYNREVPKIHKFFLHTLGHDGSFLTEQSAAELLASQEDTDRWKRTK